MKKILRENDKGKGVCYACESRVGTVYRYRDVEVDDPKLTVSDVLVAICDQCAGIVSLPWQSNQRVRTATKLERERLARSARIEARIPSELFESLKLIAVHFEVRDEAFLHVMLRYYLHELSRDPRFAKKVCRLSTEKTWGRAIQRISLRCTAQLHDEAVQIAHQHGLRESAIVRGIISAAWEDVFGKKSSKRLEILEALANATS